MEDKSVLVFGHGELATQLIKSLVGLKLHKITVLCLANSPENYVENISASLGPTHTSIRACVVDPSNKQDLTTLEQAYSEAVCVLCAGGSTEERLLIHSWGVQYRVPGLDMATQGRMGHVESFVPHLTL